MATRLVGVRMGRSRRRTAGYRLGQVNDSRLGKSRGARVDSGTMPSGAAVRHAFQAELSEGV